MLLRVHRHADTRIHTHIYVYIYICTYIHAYTHTYIYIKAYTRTIYLQIRRTGAHKVSAVFGRKPSVIVRYLSSEFRYTGYI